MSQLVLYPEDIDWQDRQQRLQPCLQQAGFIGAALRPGYFYVGERFLNLLSFMGCSPNIQIDFDPQNPQKAFCSIKIHSSVEPLLKVSKLSRPPKCPHCKKAVSDWQPFQDNQVFPCPHCRQQVQISTLNWKQQAGYACTMIFIDNIYPQEAQPTAELLGKLQQVSLCKWQHFFLS